MPERPVHRVLNLIPDDQQHILNLSVEEARRLLLSPDPCAALEIRGSFALMARDADRVCLARSLNRPLRYFLAKEPDGPMLVVADRIDAIAAALEREGYAEQFHPSYTRMAPAHCVTEIRLVGCPDPNPAYRRFFDPPQGGLPPDLDLIGRAYIEAVCAELRLWLAWIPEREPIGVLFSGGIDSGAVLLCLHHELLAAGQSGARLKALTLAVEGGGVDLAQAREFLRRTGLQFLGEEIEVAAGMLDPFEAVEVIEDYKPLDVECAAVSLALLRSLRQRYPTWRWLADGDGGDENLKDYPIEENPELTIRSVLSNPLLYHEGWGVDAVKHSLTYSGGLSRGCVRGFAPARQLGFSVISPYTAPRVVAVAEGIPFAELTGGSSDLLYRLKGEVVSRGVRQVLGCEVPVFPKRRFQHGAVPESVVRGRFNVSPVRYRRHFLARYETN
ncbi:MAG: asparagine synthetase B family protein [Gemmatimonadetes bacterium]|nr:asparagine synthetase B family protein [Gemmatimonadota bacterium]